MTARGQGWAAWAVAALAGVAVVAGLSIAGGPGQARKERRDEARMEDLSRLSGHISCLVADSGVRELPAALTATPGCPGPVPLTDSWTGEAYRIEPLEKGKYRLCAGFELSDPDKTNHWAVNPRDGDCMVFSLPSPRPAQLPEAWLPETRLPEDGLAR